MSDLLILITLILFAFLLQGCDLCPFHFSKEQSCLREQIKHGEIFETPEGEPPDVLCDDGYAPGEFAKGLRCVEVHRVCVHKMCHKVYSFEEEVSPRNGLEPFAHTSTSSSSNPLDDDESSHRQLYAHGHHGGGGTGWAKDLPQKSTKYPQVCEKQSEPAAEQKFDLDAKNRLRVLKIRESRHDALIMLATSLSLLALASAIVSHIIMQRRTQEERSEENEHHVIESELDNLLLYDASA